VTATVRPARLGSLFPALSRILLLITSPAAAPASSATADDQDLLNGGEGVGGDDELPQAMDDDGV
jgi:hypothetical protein